jgi:hypothetical protein
MMIKFALRCERGHEFESWFPDGSAFEAQARRGFVQCVYCESIKVEKAIMAPAVHASRALTMPASNVNEPARPSTYAILDEKHREFREAIRELKRKIEADTTDVGARFPDVARAMHAGEEPDRPIRGQASVEDARALIEEGIGVLPIPALPDEAN